MAAPLATLPDRAIIEITGDETLAFLQDLITADVENLKSGEAAHGGLLTPQGKILFDFFVLATDSGVLIDCAREQRDALLQRLMMYKLRLPLEIAARDDLSVAVAWDGEPGSRPEGVTCFADPRLAALGWRVVGPSAVIGGFASVDADEYRNARYRQGLADSLEVGSGELFPHEANYDQFGSVNFKKGCYVGQEVVSRMQHRGTARSRIVPVEAQSGLPESGAPVMAGSRQSGKLIAASGILAWQ
jgi:folate-binding protein YgfZ